MDRRKNRALAYLLITILSFGSITLYLIFVDGMSLRPRDIFAIPVAMIGGLFLHLIFLEAVKQKDQKARNRRCPVCKQFVVKTAAYCHNCQSQIEPELDVLPEPSKFGKDYPEEGNVLCPRCHEQIRGDARRCHYCQFERTLTASE